MPFSVHLLTLGNHERRGDKAIENIVILVKGSRGRWLTVIEPIPETIEPILHEILSRSKIEPWIDYVTGKLALGDIIDVRACSENTFVGYVHS